MFCLLCATCTHEVPQEILGTPVVPFFPFSFPGLLIQGTLIIEGLLGNLESGTFLQPFANERHILGRPRNGGIIGMQENPSHIFAIIPYGYYYWVGLHLGLYEVFPECNRSPRA